MEIPFFRGKISYLFLGLILSGTPCFPHAHIFIDYRVNAVIDDAGLKGVYVSWTFDRMFSATIIKEFDKNKDKKLQKDEIQQVYKKSFLNLKRDNYFTVIKLGNKVLPVHDPTEFTAELVKKGKSVSYLFFIPLNIPAEKTERKLRVYFFDPVIYVAFTIMKKDISMNNRSKNVSADISLKRDKFMNCPVISFRKPG